MRAFVRNRPMLAMLLVFATLAVKLLVPTGLMLAPANGILTVTICADGMGAPETMQIAIPGQKSGGHADAGKAAKGGDACPYSALSMAALGGADDLLLADALAFILLLGVIAVALPRLARRSHILPPQCGPPALI